MLGKTGAGKSSLGNNLTRACLRKFKVGRGLKSETKYCDWSYGTWDNLTIEVGRKRVKERESEGVGGGVGGRLKDGGKKGGE